MNRKDIFLEQLLACHNENNWFVSLQSALDGLTEEQAAWKNTDGTNSIWEIVNHLIFWNDRVLKRFYGSSVQEHIETNDDTFQNPRNLDWNSTVAQIDTIMDKWQTALHTCDETKLDLPRSAETEETWTAVLLNFTIHNAYHIGQIISIRKQQGNWNSEHGVH
ncbi:DinB family protein [Bacillus pseudomycoides]|uniref:DinB family protein n=1 Tax=Bacillus pseudomycoides TaxID=64104 RepID=UPI001FB558E2|nr:DinB family protein [Bacillus pseudomycoides]